MGFEISLFRGHAAVWDDGNTQWQLHGSGPNLPGAALRGGPGTGLKALPVPSTQPGGEGPGDETGLFGQWQSHSLSVLTAFPSQWALVG